MAQASFSFMGRSPGRPTLLKERRRTDRQAFAIVLLVSWGTARLPVLLKAQNEQTMDYICLEQRRNANSPITFVLLTGGLPFFDSPY